MSKTYKVYMPIAGHVVKAVEAESAKDAIEKVMDDSVIAEVGCDE